MLKKRKLPPEQSRTAKWSSPGNSRWLLAGAILFPLAGAFVAWEEGPLLVRDFSLGENLLPAKRFRLVDGRCRSRLVLYSCQIKASALSGSAPNEMELKYIFAGQPFAQHSIRLLEKTSDPAMLTTDLGQQKLLNRAVTLLVLLSLCFSTPLIYFRALKRGRLARQISLKQQSATAAP